VFGLSFGFVVVGFARLSAARIDVLFSLITFAWRRARERRALRSLRPGWRDAALADGAIVFCRGRVFHRAVCFERGALGRAGVT